MMNWMIQQNLNLNLNPNSNTNYAQLHPLFHRLNATYTALSWLDQDTFTDAEIQQAATVCVLTDKSR
jgi:hypothetical protein